MNTLIGNDFFNIYIKDKPKGIVRDFYIWQYLQNSDLSAQDINKAYLLLANKNPYIKKILKNLGMSEELPRDIVCNNMNINLALSQDEGCLATNLKANLSKTNQFDKKDIEIIESKLSNKYKDLKDSIKILNSHNIKESIFNSNIAVFNMVFNALSYESKNKIFTNIDIEKLDKLTQNGNLAFFNILNRVVLDSKMWGFKQALLKLNIKNATHNTSFLLGINELRFGSKKKALNYFQIAYNKANDPFFKDRASFWQYQVSMNKNYLEDLLKSTSVNIFSIYAKDKLGKQPSYKIINNIPSLNTQNPPFNTQDPYVWQNIVNSMLNTTDSLKLANTITYFSYIDTMPHLAYLMQKIDKYTTNYFITPYDNLVKFNSNKEKSFVYAIARQESHFIPTLISKSFALGVMQIMPANVPHFAKDMGLENISYNDLFNPKIALEMGAYYIRELQKEYKNPLFVAYAYNGGPGFLRRILSKNELFLQNREYEPWLSMELIPYEESRFYGMKIVANYIIYESIFGRDINIEQLLKKTLIYNNPTINQ